VVEFDRFHAKQTAPVRLIPETVLKGALRVLLAEVDVDRFTIAGLNKRAQAHSWDLNPCERCHFVATSRRFTAP
jgi:hypothetical protein